jgi:hypothetical protein
MQLHWLVVVAFLPVSWSSEPSYNVTIGIQLDSKPEETGFSLVDLDSLSNNIIVQRDPGYYAGQQYQYVEESISVVAGNYAVTVEDSGNDGLCDIASTTSPAPSPGFQTIPCASDVTSFSSEVLVGFAGDASLATDGQLQVLGQAFTGTYNQLNAYNSELCDPLFRFVNGTGVQIQPGFGRRFLSKSSSSSSNKYVGTVSSFFSASGSCRGCPKQTPLFNDAVNKGRRFLEEEPHRSLQDSCACHSGAELNPPSPQDFLTAFSDTVQQLIASGALTFVVGVLDISSLDPISCDTSVSDFESNLVVNIEGDSSMINDNDLEVLGQVFTESYNSVNAYSSQICDPQFKLLDDSSVAIAPDLLNTSNRMLGSTKVKLTSSIKVTGTCRGCSSSSSLYNDAAGRRSLLPQENESAGRNLQTRGCYCPPNAEIRQPFLAEFNLALNQSIQEAQSQGFLSFVASVGSPTELFPINCSDLETFSTSASVTLVYDPDLVTDEQLLILGQGFSDTYNAINGPNPFTCDPLFRTLSSGAQVEFSRRLSGSSSSKSSKSGSVTFKVTGQCRGCKSSPSLFNDASGRLLISRPVDDGFRLLQSSNESSCFCAAGAEQRAPTPGEFEQAFAETIIVLTQEGSLTFVAAVETVDQLIPINCSDFQIVSSSATVTLVYDPDLVTDTQLQILGQAFSDTYNTINTPNDNTCDPMFRTIVGGAQVELSRRMLKSSSSSSSKTAAVPMTVSVRCNNCKSSTLLFNDVSGRMLLSRPVDDGFRFLQSSNESSCFCPAGAQQRAPTPGEFEQAFAETIIQLTQEGSLTFVTAVESVDQLIPVNCGDFQIVSSGATVTLVYDPDLVTDIQLQILGQAFSDTYNTINTPNDNTCDPMFRTIVGEPQVELSRRMLKSSSSSGSKTAAASMKVSVKCSQCKSSTLLFNDVSGRMLLPRPVNDGFRSLQSSNDTNCFCAAGAQQRAPTPGEFEQAFNETLVTLIQAGNLTFIISLEGVANPVITPSLAPSRVPSTSLINNTNTTLSRPTQAPSVSMEPSASLAPYTLEPTVSRRLLASFPSNSLAAFSTPTTVARQLPQSRELQAGETASPTQKQSFQQDFSISVTVDYANNTIFSATEGCDFGSQFTIPFSIAAFPTIAPSVSTQPSLSPLSSEDPHCRDSRSASFKVPPFALNKTCTWLAPRLKRNFPGSNQTYKENVCVASNRAFFVCQSSCETCQTNNSVCADNTNPFDTNVKALGYKDCAWLANFSGGGRWVHKLCVPGQAVYNNCLSTCGVCDLLSQSTSAPSQSGTKTPVPKIENAATSRIPTHRPTKKMSRAPIPSVCEDNPVKTFYVPELDESKTCHWLTRSYNHLISNDIPSNASDAGLYKNLNWGSLLCSTNVRRICRLTCGQCTSCVDNSTATFSDVRNSKIQRNCAWLQGNIAREFGPYCSPGHPAANICHKTCQTC